jgi:hypothetical protein
MLFSLLIYFKNEKKTVGDWFWDAERKNKK